MIKHISRRRILCALCILALAFCLLAGCGRKDKTAITSFDQLGEPGTKIGAAVPTVSAAEEKATVTVSCGGGRFDPAASMYFCGFSDQILLMRQYLIAALIIFQIIREYSPKGIRRALS